MSQRRKKTVLFLINAVIFIFLFVFEYTNSFSFALPFFSLAFLIACCVFCSELTAFFSALVIGTAVDTSSAAHYGFNAIVFMIIGLAVALTVHYLFNKNIRSCIALALLGSTFYFVLSWLFFYAFRIGAAGTVSYFLTVSLPSILYTAVFVIPFYYLERWLYKKLSL